MLSFFVYSDLKKFGITQLQYNKMTCENMEDQFFSNLNLLQNRL